MTSRMIGIEIGSHTLKMAVCSGGVVKKVAVSRLPEDLISQGRVTSIPAFVDFLKLVMKNHGIRPGPCALVLPSSLVIANRVSMPVVSHSEVLLNLPFEFRDFVGKEAASYEFDYSVIGVKDNVMELYAAAVRKDVVEEYYAIFKKVGLRLKIATPAEMAWLNLVRQQPNLPRKLCIVDIGHSTTRVSIFTDGNFVMGKTIEKGGALIDEYIADTLQIDSHVARTQKEANMNKVQNEEFCQDAYQNLTIEVMKTLNFYGYSEAAEDGQLEHLYYTGGSSQIDPLRNTLLKGTNLVQHHIHRMVNMGENENALALFCALAAGAAMQQ